jgi:hypothetical protein
LPVLLVLLGAGHDTSLPRKGTFSGEWTVLGREDTLDFVDSREVAISRHRGTINLKQTGGLPRTFFSNCLGFRDTKVSSGRCEWVDANDDKLFIETKRQLMGADDLVRGDIVGGTGRYAGISGTIELRVWVYSAPNEEEGVIQAFTDSLQGSWTFQ